MTVSIRGATAPEMMSFQGKYAGHQGVYFCPSDDPYSENWWLSFLGDCEGLILYARHEGRDVRRDFKLSDTDKKCFKPDKLIVPMEYLT